MKISPFCLSYLTTSDEDHTVFFYTLKIEQKLSVCSIQPESSSLTSFIVFSTLQTHKQPIDTHLIWKTKQTNKKMPLTILSLYVFPPH